MPTTDLQMAHFGYEYRFSRHFGLHHREPQVRLGYEQGAAINGPAYQVTGAKKQPISSQDSPWRMRILSCSKLDGIGCEALPQFRFE